MNKDLMIIFVVLTIITVIIFSTNYVEKFSDDEAVQNVASIYNNSNMKVTNLEVTGNLVSHTMNKLNSTVSQFDSKFNSKLDTKLNEIRGEMDGLINQVSTFKSSFNKKGYTKAYGSGNKKDCNPSTSGSCAQNCPAGYYMSGLSHGRNWDWKHPICTKFT